MNGRVNFSILGAGICALSLTVVKLCVVIQEIAYLCSFAMQYPNPLDKCLEHRRYFNPSAPFYHAKDLTTLLQILDVVLSGPVPLGS